MCYNLGLLFCNTFIVYIMIFEEIEKVKKEADKLMIKTIEKYELKLKKQKEINDNHQKLNGKLQEELTESKKKECKCNTKT